MVYALQNMVSKTFPPSGNKNSYWTPNRVERHSMLQDRTIFTFYQLEFGKYEGVNIKNEELGRFMKNH